MRQRGWPFPAQGSGIELILKKSSYGIAGELVRLVKNRSQNEKSAAAQRFL